MVDILQEVTATLKPDEIYQILVRRVARGLRISKCSILIGSPDDEAGTVVARRVVTASLAADHRASDGHRGALFLQAIGRLLQEPEKL